MSRQGIVLSARSVAVKKPTGFSYIKGS